MSSVNDNDEQKGKDEEKNTIGDGDKREPIKPIPGTGGLLTDKISEVVKGDKDNEDKDENGE